MKWGVVCLRVFPCCFLKTAPGSPSTHISSLSAWFVVHFVFPLCIFRPTFRLSEFRLSKWFFFSICLLLFCLGGFSPIEKSNIVSKPLVCKVFSIDIDFFTYVCLLKDFLHNTTAVNSLGKNGSPCLTPLFTGNSSDTNLSKWIPAVAWLSMFSQICMYVSFILVFLNASKMAECSTVSKAFS